MKTGQEVDKPIKIFLVKIFFPYVFSSIGGMIFVIILGLFLGVLIDPIITEQFLKLSIIVPLCALIFLIGGFIFLKKEIENISETKTNPQ